MDENELKAKAAFLKEALPSDLAGDQLEVVAAAARAELFPTGTTILSQGGEPASFLYVIRSGAVEIRADGQLLDVPGVGEIFGELSLVSGAAPTATVRAGEPVECLLIDRAAAMKVLGTGGGVAYVQESLRRSLTQALDTDGRSTLDAIERAEDETTAVAALHELPRTVCTLVAGGADAVKIGRVIGTSVDALTRRVLSFAIEDLGEPPVPWAWLALGSEARLEQALHTDQDHALAFDPGDRPAEDLDPYFAKLAERVTAALESAGIPRCHGDAMAIHPGLRRPLSSWQTAIRGWMADPGMDGSILSSIVFDFRQVDGPLSAEPVLHAVVAEAPAKYPQFLRHLAQRSLDRKPPTGFLRNLVVESKGEHAGKLDIKHGGVTIVSNLARSYTISKGGSEKATLERLRAANARGQIDEESTTALSEAFRLLWQIRLEHQVAQVADGIPPDDFVDPARLGPIARLGLKEAFKIVLHEQQSLAADLGVNA